MTKPITASVMVAALASLPVAAHADEVIDEVLVILSSDSQQTQGMAMVLSNTMAKQGARVNVLLCDKAGDLALDSYTAQPMKPENVTPGELLRGLIKQGGPVSVCALYLPNSEHTENDLIDGVDVAMRPEIAARMLNPAIRTFTF